MTLTPIRQIIACILTGFGLGVAITLDGTNCYPDYIRCTSASAVTLTLAAGQSAAVGRRRGEITEK